MMNGRGKSDSAIVAERPTNKAGQPAAEPEERRAETEGNAVQQNTRRLRTGKACPRRWIAYDKQQDRERRKSSPLKSPSISPLPFSSQRKHNVTSPQKVEHQD